MTGMVYQRLTSETSPCGDADPSRQFLDDIEGTMMGDEQKEQPDQTIAIPSLNHARGVHVGPS
jgi:hypothetical protein